MNIEKFIRKFGDINSAFIDEAAEYRRKRSVIMNIKKIAAIAAAVIITLTVTVSATAFTGLIGKEKALGSAFTFAVSHADNVEQRDELANLIIGGYSYDESAEETEISLGLLGLRPVYNVSFKVGGYAYDMQVDAKSGVVTGCSREVDENWAEHIKTADNRIDVSSELTPTEAMLIAQDWFGLYDTGNCVEGSVASTVFERTDDEYIINTVHGGYSYSCNIGVYTAAVTNISITEVNSSGKRHMHEPTDEFIGLYEASRIVCKEMNVFYSDDSLNTSDGHYINVGFIAKVQYREDRTIDSGYDTDIYMANVQVKNQPLRVTLIIDARTGEIISNSAQTSDPTLAPNQEVSTDAPDGLISEAVAKAIAIESAGVDETRVSDFKIELADGKYEISFESFRINNDGTAGLYDFVYEIDAESGAILSCDVNKIA